jgi:hypothetical protein
MDQKLKYALILAFVINSSLALSGFYDRTFDSYAHMFFADHYRRSWFNAWEPKWYGGFSVFSYPPLAHQVIALVSYGLGLVWAYQILTLALSVMFPLAVFKFSGIFVSDDAAGYASIISVFLPSILVTTYNFGQFPTLLSLVAALFTIHYLSKYLENGNKLHFGLTCCLLGVTVSAHHFTALFFLPILMVIVFANMVQKRICFKTLVKRFVVFLVVGFSIALFVIYPFFLFSGSANMQPIPHITRTNLFSDLFSFEWFFLAMYGPTLVLIPSAVFFLFRNRRLTSLVIGAVFLFILGLGGTTILPRLILGDLWMFLTYDRFALWAGVAFLPLFGLFFESQLNQPKHGKFRKAFLSVFFISLVLSSLYFANSPILQSTSVDLRPIQEFLSKNGISNWRYITLGFGDAKMGELSLTANASTLDGFYFTGRTIPILADSGIGTLDSAKHYGDHGMYVLDTVLGNASNYNLKWVFCNDPYYYSLLAKNNFTVRWSQENTGDLRYHGVSIWGKEEVPPLDSESANITKTHQTSLSDYVWGIAPLTLVISSLVLSASIVVLRKRQVLRTKEAEYAKK